MEHVKKHSHYIISALIVSGIAFAAMNFSGPPLFNSLDNFILFASEKIKLEQGVQVSSGDLGSNKVIDINKDAIINGNLFANEITIDKNTTINGNVSFNKLKTEKEIQILGTQTKPVQLPIANLPEIPDFQIGTRDFKFEGQNNSLVSGNYKNIALEKNSRLTLSGGTYNINRLFLKENSTLIFFAPTTLNIKKELKSQQHIAIFPDNNNLKPTDLTINYIGIRAKQGKEEKEDDGEEINSLQDDKEKKNNKDGKIGRPIIFGKNSFLNFKLLVPEAAVHVGEDSTIRGQVLARKVRVKKGSSLSSGISVSSQPRLSEIASTEEGARFVVNQIILQLTPDGTLDDANTIVSTINGRIVGIIPSINLYQIAVSTGTLNELDVIIQQIISQQNPKIKIVSKNIIINLIQ